MSDQQQSALKSPPGKTTAYGIVRDANGGIKVDDWASLDPVLKQLIKEELANGGHLSNNQRP